MWVKPVHFAETSRICAHAKEKVFPRISPAVLLGKRRFLLCRRIRWWTWDPSSTRPAALLSSGVCKGFPEGAFESTSNRRTARPEKHATVWGAISTFYSSLPRGKVLPELAENEIEIYVHIDLNSDRRRTGIIGRIKPLNVYFVGLQGKVVAGQGHIDEILVLKQLMEHRSHVALVVVPSQTIVLVRHASCNKQSRITSHLHPMLRHHQKLPPDIDTYTYYLYTKLFRNCTKNIK